MGGVGGGRERRGKKREKRGARVAPMVLALMALRQKWKAECRHR